MMGQTVFEYKGLQRGFPVPNLTIATVALTTHQRFSNRFKQ